MSTLCCINGFIWSSLEEQGLIFHPHGDQIMILYSSLIWELWHHSCGSMLETINARLTVRHWSIIASQMHNNTVHCCPVNVFFRRKMGCFLVCTHRALVFSFKHNYLTTPDNLVCILFDVFCLFCCFWSTNQSH